MTEDEAKFASFHKNVLGMAKRLSADTGISVDNMEIQWAVALGQPPMAVKIHIESSYDIAHRPAVKPE